MFHRRLVLLGGCVVVAAGGLSAQLARLTLVQGEERRADAEAKLVTKEWTPPGGPTRGRILDRKGRVLAQNRPSFDVRVDYRSISGDWAKARGAAAARRAYASQWRSLDP